MKVIKRNFHFCLFFLMFVGSLLGCNVIGNNQDNKTVTLLSPNNTYTVIIKGAHVSRDGSTFHAALVDAYKAGKIVVKDDEIYSGTAYDTYFFSLYSTQKWLTDSVLSLGPKQKTKSLNDDILLSNNSKTTIAYLLIDAGSYKFLIFDLAPSSKVLLQANVSVFSQSTYCRGIWDGGKIMSDKGTHFNIPVENRQQPSKYCISINDNDVSIVSDKYEGRSLENLIVPKDTTCSK